MVGISLWHWIRFLNSLNLLPCQRESWLVTTVPPGLLWWEIISCLPKPLMHSLVESKRAEHASVNNNDHYVNCLCHWRWGSWRIPLEKLQYQTDILNSTFTATQKVSGIAWEASLGSGIYSLAKVLPPHQQEPGVSGGASCLNSV